MSTLTECCDIDLARDKLAAFKKNMEGIRGVIEAILKNERADFDPGDFKRMERVARE